ncbi:hypothetical protein OU800_12450 [Pseudomonas sp. GOM7]|uniref:hypothetical protein n=1 Tax=Pseudomonas sp. GOM7 TaxID=2998079 RepID=UPI00227A8238|nr:hypothetical protein [Pseudomonas sp. GOM7]WAJ35458.1 hypothetical protein OU800_12450 [Pseudomonas sp. GOM7]
MSAIDYGIANKDGKPVAYLNQTQTLSLTLTNVSGADLELAGSPPVLETEADSNTSLLYLFLGNLVSDPAAVQVSCPGWTTQFQNTPQGPVWCLAQAQNSTFKDKAKLTVTLDGVNISGLPGSRQVTVDCWFGDGDSVQLPVMAQNDPGKLLPLNLVFALNGGNVIYITEKADSPITCSLVFRLSNPSPDTPLVPDDVPWGAQAPSFTLSFVYADKGDGFGALTSAERAASFTRQTVQDYGNRWSVAPDTQGSPSWTLTPDQLTNKQILGTGEQASFEFMLGNIVTQLKAGTTLAYLQWSNIPGYQDGYQTVALIKQAPTPGILRFMTLNSSVIKQGTPVQLNWQTFALSKRTISWSQDNTPYQVVVPANASAWEPNPQPDDTVTYTLDGYDFNGNKVPNAQQTVSVIANAPVINCFSVSPRVAAFEGANPNVQVTGTWQASNVKTQQLNGTPGPSPQTIGLNTPGDVRLLITGFQDQMTSQSQTVYSTPGYVQTFVSTSQVSGGTNGPLIKNVLAFERGTNTGTWTLIRSDALATLTLAIQGFTWSTNGLNVNLVFNDASTTATLGCAFGNLTLTARSGSSDANGLQPLAMLVQNAAGQNAPVFSAVTTATGATQPR